MSAFWARLFGWREPEPGPPGPPGPVGPAGPAGPVNVLHEERIARLEAEVVRLAGAVANALGGPGTGPGPGPTPPAPETQTLTYTEDQTTDYLNPERGFHSEYGPGSGSQLANVRGQGYSLNRVYFRLDNYRNSAIPSGVLDSYGTYFAQARAAGIKVIPRWSYNFGYDADAPLSRVLQHIDQLQPVWTENADVIAALQAGFIGAWGEWHSSTNGLTSAGNMTTIANAILDALPDSRMAQFRTPGYLNTVFGAALADSDRFGTSNKSRAGFKNDCFQTNGSDAGTFGDRSYVHQMGRLTVVGGETCEVSGLNSTNDAAPSMTNLGLQSWDYLNSAFYSPVLSKWTTQGAMPEIRRRLGYRLALTSATLPVSVTASASFTVSFTVRNRGWGKVYNPRPIDLVFVGSGGPFTVRLSADARRDLPLGGATETLEYTASAPAGLVTGQSYALHVRLPDADSGLAANDRYTIRFANSGLWDSGTGRHDLGATVTAVSA